MGEGCFKDAIVYYTRGLRYTPRNEKLLLNRSAAYLKVFKYDLALEDAQKAQEIQPRWAKIFFRKDQGCAGGAGAEEEGERGPAVMLEDTAVHHLALRARW